MRHHPAWFCRCRVNSKQIKHLQHDVVRRIIDASAPAGASLHPARGSVRCVNVDEGGAGQRLDNFLLRLLKGVPKTHVYRVIRSGEVRVNRGRATADTRLALGDEVRVPPVRVAERSVIAPAREFPILLEDDHLIAVDKPAGVAVHGGSGVSFGVIEQLRRARPQARFLELVHRLDKQTSGVLLVAKKRSALTALQQQFRSRATDKTYAALVVGTWPASRKVVDVALHKTTAADGARRVRAVDNDDDAGRRSITLVKVARRCQGYTLLEVVIKTGRTHQIRVHLAHEGHAIVGDDQYGDFELNRQLARGEGLAGMRFARMFLHARRLAFDHPASGERVVIESPLPAECVRLLGVLCEPH
jgi:23S rRNA pseudouridine955/2504/2580 synthase